MSCLRFQRICRSIFLTPILISFFWCAARAERLPIKIFTSADGLGSSFVNYLMRDSRGFLWVCTRDGLSRFDGSRFVTYQVGDNDPGIEQIIETRKGIYWILTTAGLYRFDPNAPPPVTTAQNERLTLNARFVTSERGVLYEDHSGTLWLGEQNLFRIKEQNEKPTFEKVELNLPPTLYKPFDIAKICEAEDGSFWLISNWGVVRRLPDGREILYRISDPRSNILRSIITDRSGRVWVGAVNSIYVILPESANELSSLGALTLRELDKSVITRPLAALSMSQPDKPGEVLRYFDPEGARSGYGEFLHQTADGHIWISNTTSVREFDGKTLDGYTAANGLIEDAEEFVEDAGGNLWLSGHNGLMRFDRHGLTSYFSDDGLAYPYILSINKTRDDKLYVLTRDLSLSKFDGRHFQTTHPLPPEAQAGWASNPGFQDSAGEWWFATTAKLYRFAAVDNFSELARQRSRATYDSRDGLNGDEMFHIWEDSHHDLWISTRGPQGAQAGLSRWSRATEKFFTFSASEGFPPNRIPNSFAEARNGDLWFGFYDGGLVRYAAGRFVEFKVSEGAPRGFITALHFDQHGRLWVGSSQNGLSRVDDPSSPHPQFVSFKAENGLASNNVRSITEDLFGNIYVGGARGLDRISADTTRVKHFSTSDGLAGDFVSTSFRDSSGALWFGTPNGLSRLIPNENKAAGAPSIWLSGLRIAGERRRLADLGSTEILVSELGHTQNSLQIDFFGIDFGAGESLRYQYKLEGADQNWSAPTDQRTVAFANLQPGRYRFLVRAVNADGIVSLEPAILTFRILPPIWQRWWFLTIAFILLSGVALMWYRYRVRRLLELEHMRMRIATDLHDDIGSILSQIAILSEVARKQLSQAESLVTKPLARIASLSRESVDSMSDIVWAINPQKDRLSNLTQRMRHFADEVFSARDIKFRFSAPVEQEKEMGADIRRHVFLIFKEGVNNIVRHSACTEVEIEFQIERAWIRLTMRDNGRGFEPDEVKDGHGLMSLQRRARSLGGELQVTSSSNGHGTSITLQIPYRK